MKTVKIPKGYTKRTSGGNSHIEDGASVYINPSYIGKDESPKKYFVCELSDGFALIANTKKELNNGEGRIYGLYSIDYYKNI